MMNNKSAYTKVSYFNAIPFFLIIEVRQLLPKVVMVVHVKETLFLSNNITTQNCTPRYFNA